MKASEKNEIIEAEDGFSSLGAEVKKAAGGGKAILLAKEGRNMDDAAAALATQGFSVIRIAVRPGASPFDAPSREKDLPECVSAIVAVGGAAELDFAKGFTRSRALDRFSFPTELSGLTALFNNAYFVSTAGLARYPAPSQTVVLDKSLLLSAPSPSKGIGLFLMLFIEALDGAYEDLMRSGKSPSEALCALKNSAAALRDVTEENAAEKSLSGLKELSAAISEKCLSLSPSVKALSALLAGKNGDCSRYYFASAYTLCFLYERFLREIPLSVAIPPDRTRNAAMLSEFGFCASALLSRKEEILFEGGEKRRYLTAEYKDDLLAAIKGLHLPEICRAYRRLVRKEEGADEPSAKHILYLLSLTGELVSGYPLIKHIKATGLTEPLLECG